MMKIMEATMNFFGFIAKQKFEYIEQSPKW